MNHARKLTLKREALDELGPDEMGKVAGGTHENCITLPDVLWCLSIRNCNVTHELKCLLPVPTLWNTCPC